MLQMKIYTFFFPEVSLVNNFVDDFLKNHLIENRSFCIMQIGNIGNPNNVDLANIGQHLCEIHKAYWLIILLHLPLIQI